jgi:hypothetical protein
MQPARGRYTENGVCKLERSVKKGAKQTGIKQELGVCVVLLLLQSNG